MSLGTALTIALIAVIWAVAFFIVAIILGFGLGIAVAVFRGLVYPKRSLQAVK